MQECKAALFSLALLFAFPHRAMKETGQLANFHPETVTRYGCRVSRIDVVAGKSRADKWAAEAYAAHSIPIGQANADGEDWQRMIAYRPPTANGRTKALQDCDAWMRAADKAVLDTNPKRDLFEPHIHKSTAH